jgi:hypothetical protein
MFIIRGVKIKRTFLPVASVAYLEEYKSRSSFPEWRVRQLEEAESSFHNQVVRLFEKKVNNRENEFDDLRN